MSECKHCEERMTKIHAKTDTKLDRNWFTFIVLMLLAIFGSIMAYTNININSYARASEFNHEKTGTIIHQVQMTVNEIAVEQRYIKRDIEELKKK